MDKNAILQKYMNQSVNIYLKNGSTVFGAIIGFDTESFNNMKKWKVIENINMAEYKKTKDEKLLIDIEHYDIESIEYQII